MTKSFHFVQCVYISHYVNFTYAFMTLMMSLISCFAEGLFSMGNCLMIGFQILDCGTFILHE